MPFTPPNKWAMVIGASDYKTLGKLNFAAKDAEAFADVLKDRFGFNQDAIELLTDSPASTQKPTVDQIQDVLNRTLQDKRLNKGDLFIFYFSGHGIGTPKGDFLMPTDATAEEAEKSGQSVKALVESFVKAGLRNVLVIVDACRGGERNTFGAEFRKLGREANIAVMLSCEPGERSYEYPRLGHGIFTSYLLRSLKSADLTSPSTGTLWASAIFKDVGKKVREYTVRDYPTKPQNPAGWAETTMDVSLGVFPAKGAVRLKLIDIMAEGQRLDQKEMVDYLRRTAASLYEKGRYAESVDVYKTIDGMQPLTPSESFLYANGLEEEGRTFESEKVFLTLRKGSKEDIFTHLATLQSPSRMVSPTDRLKAAQELWRLHKEEWVVQVVYPALTLFGSRSDVNEFLENGLKLGSIHPRTRLFFEGMILANKSEWKSAREKWEVALKTIGPYPTNDLLRLEIYQTLVNLNQVGEMDSFLQASAKDPLNPSAHWGLLLAQFYKETGKIDQMMTTLEQTLTKEMDGEELLKVMRIAGARYGLLGDKIVQKASEKPYGWKSILAKDWIQLASTDPMAFIASIQNSTKYCDDEFAVMYECLQILDSIFDDLLQIDKLPADVYSQFMVAYSATMAANVGQFGYQSNFWMLFNKFAVNAEKLEQAQALYNLYLGPRLDNGTLDPLLRAPYLFIALQVDDIKRVEQLWKLGGMPTADQTDAQWLISMFYAVRGDLEKAKSLLPQIEPSSTFGPAAETYRAYLKVKDGARPDLLPLATKFKDSPSAMHWLAIALVETNDWKSAMPILEQNVMLRQQGFFFLQAKATEIYFKHLLAQKQFEKANELAHNISISGFGNPIYAQIHYGPKPGIELFQGSIELEAAEFEVPPAMGKGSMSLKIEASGNITGTVTIQGETKAVSGHIDQFGNLKAQAQEGQKSWQMTGKIAPPSLYKTLPIFKTSVQIFLLLDNQGQARYLIGRPKS